MKKAAEVTPQPCVCTSAASDVLDKSPLLALGFIFSLPYAASGLKACLTCSGPVTCSGSKETIQALAFCYCRLQLLGNS